ncbi:MAG: hypothetical protein HUU21_10530 [Polyangiaceae bacterium]|nr:hypothetical protein [Polyangiaceae bacterium]
MKPDLFTPQNRNVLLVVLLLLSMLFSAFDEGYIRIISPFLWAMIATGFGLALWLARTSSTERFMALSLSIFVMEYIKESMGIRAGLWEYHGDTGRYAFGVWVWVLVGLDAHTLAMRFLHPQFQKRLQMLHRIPRWVSPLSLAVISLSIPLLLGPNVRGVGVFFWIFYSILLIIGCITAFRVGFMGFASFVLVAWAVAAPSEIAGSVASGVWTYPHDKDGPPLFLIVGCWPLEILAQAGLAGLFMGETILSPMDKA